MVVVKLLDLLYISPTSLGTLNVHIATHLQN